MCRVFPQLLRRIIRRVGIVSHDQQCFPEPQLVILQGLPDPTIIVYLTPISNVIRLSGCLRITFGEERGRSKSGYQNVGLLS